MKRYFYALMVAVFATMSLVVTGCSKDDDLNGGSGTFTINGQKYTVQNIMTWDGYWDDGYGTFTVSLLDKDKNVCGYEFEFESSSEPKVGDNFANMSLTMTAMDVGGASILTKFSYVSGSATAQSFGKGTMTVKFSELEMTGKDPLTKETFTYVFNGTATVDFAR